MKPREIDSAAGFRAAIVEAATHALASRAWQLMLVDPHFDGWPLDDPAMLQALADFARLPGRRVVMLGGSFDAVARACPRFVAWHRDWGHAISALRPVDEGTVLPALLLVDRQLAVRLLDRDRWRGQVLVDASRLQAMAEELDAFVQRSEPTFGATTLGL